MRQEGPGSEETQGNFTQVSHLSLCHFSSLITFSFPRRFKIFDCPHCNDKFCTQDDLERHLAKIEKNNIVEGSQASQIKAVRQKPKPVKEPEPEVEKPQETEMEKQKEKEKEKEEKIGIDENIEPVDTTEIVKELEAKTYSCSECGLKTHSRMTYIQHVLNGCIMDMVLGEVEVGHFHPQ